VLWRVRRDFRPKEGTDPQMVPSYCSTPIRSWSPTFWVTIT
jgi:hypothetical protein